MTKSRQDRLLEILTRLHTAQDELDGLASEVEESAEAVAGTNLAGTERNQRIAEASETLNNNRDAIGDALDELDGVEL